jgi:hypothetical protein
MVPSQAAGVKTGVSQSTKPWLSKKSRTARMISWRTREDRVLTARAQPEMTMIHQKVDPVLLRTDRVVAGQLDDLKSAGYRVRRLPGRFGMLARYAGDDDRRLLRHLLDVLPRLDSATSFFETTPWIVPEPSRTSRKPSFPLDRLL